MKAEDIRELQHRQPFKPFRVYLSDGRTFDVKHPETIFVLRNALEIGFTETTTSTIPDRVERLSLLHIVSIEDLQVA